MLPGKGATHLAYPGHHHAGLWRSMGISGRLRRGAELNWVASTDVGVGMVWGGASRCIRHPVGPSHVCHVHGLMSGLSGGVPRGRFSGTN
jgi:hypothetical protein